LTFSNSINPNQDARIAKESASLNTPLNMKTTIELTPGNAAALAKYAALAGRPPAEFLNQYLEENMVALFENPRAGNLESYLANLEYHTRADAERVVAWIEKRVIERARGPFTLETDIHQTDEGLFWIEATTVRNGLADRIYGARPFLFV
jgi:hypothetical protein